jgi:hypothetical protein
MKQIRTFYDERNDAFCSYCGKFPDTRDHVPSRILLDTPFPDNLPVVPCCQKCNNNFSLDEEFIACVIECIICDTYDLNLLKNIRIKNILERKNNLYQSIKEIFRNNIHNDIITKYFDRFKNIGIKLAKGHYKFENGELLIDEPNNIMICLLENLSPKDKSIFLNCFDDDILPEVGSRKLINMFENGQVGWVEVQKNVYRYSVIQKIKSTLVRIIIREQLAIGIEWNMW